MAFPERRTFLVAASALLASPLARSQERQRRIGCLFGGSPRTHARVMEAFRQGLGELGWTVGRNVALEMHWAEGRMDRVPSLAAELVRSKPDVILTAANPIVAELTKATRSIPIVMATGADPVESGLVASLGRPGGNFTGLSSQSVEVTSKRLELLKELVPGAAPVAVLWDRTNLLSWQEAEAAAQARGWKLLSLELREAGEMEAVFKAATAARAGAALVIASALLINHAQRVAELAARSRLPAMYPLRPYVEAGGLISYASDIAEIYRRAAASSTRS